MPAMLAGSAQSRPSRRTKFSAASACISRCMVCDACGGCCACCCGEGAAIACAAIGLFDAPAAADIWVWPLLDVAAWLRTELDVAVLDVAACEDGWLWPSNCSDGGSLLRDDGSAAP